MHSSNLVREVTPDGKTVAEFKTPATAGDADRLPNGHTLVAHAKGVMEFDTKGKVVWQHKAQYAAKVSRY